jgi:hypothetical protein
MADVVDELYDVPLAQFVRRRNAVADRLRAAGKAREAKAVRAIAKPKTTVWSVNKVAREDRTSIERVLAAFDRLKRAQLRRPAEIGAAAETLRTAIESVVHKATAAIGAAGGAVSVDTHRRIATTLRGAAAGARKELLAGALTEEVSAPGFELFGDAMPRGRRPRASARAPAPRSDGGAVARDAMLQRRAQQLEEEARARKRDAERAASGAFEARQRLRELEAAAKSAQRTARKAVQRSERARRHASRGGRRRATD